MLEALVWGALAASSLLIGGLIALRFRLGSRVIGLIMAFGAGVLISAVAYELVLEAVDQGSPLSVALGLFAGALTFYAGDALIDRAGGAGRKASTAPRQGEGALAIVLGTVLDGIPESLVLGLTLVGGQEGLSFLVAVFLSNVPESLSATAGLKDGGWPDRKIAGIWVAVMAVSALSAAAGYGVFSDASPELVAFVLAFAAGAILTMLADTMMPEAFDGAGPAVGLVTTFGFAAAFAIQSLE